MLAIIILELGIIYQDYCTVRSGLIITAICRKMSQSSKVQRTTSTEPNDPTGVLGQEGCALIAIARELKKRVRAP